jgi:transcription elongation factor/antiterminator RfaH
MIHVRKDQLSPPNASSREELVLGGEERWFLVHTLPRSEIRAQLHLGAQGFRTFLPQMLKTVRHARQLRTARAPYFPRYLFVALRLDRDRWLSIRSTVGVADLVTCDDRPVAVPAGIVESLIERSADANLLVSQEDLKRGQRVRLLSGPFAGLVGTLDRLDEKGRVRVLVEIMNAAVAIGTERFRLLPVA